MSQKLSFIASTVAGILAIITFLLPSLHARSLEVVETDKDHVEQEDWSATKHYPHPSFSYAYGVADDVTGDMKKAYETRMGRFVEGAYQVLQPDGILRIVTYTSDPIRGFQTKVQMLNGYAVHPISEVPELQRHRRHFNPI